MAEAFNLGGVRMNAVQTAANGVVNAATVFEFRQEGTQAWAAYAGGRVRRGFLVGLVQGGTFEFRYCQMQDDGQLDGGRSSCELRRSPEGLLQIVEHFEWGSRPGGGTNIFQELPRGRIPPTSR